jgi:hypothetical protein
LPVHALRLLVTAWFQGLAAVSMSSPGAFMKHPARTKLGQKTRRPMPFYATSAVVSSGI